MIEIRIPRKDRYYVLIVGI